jgi:DNA-binding FrmR family transcriptional regulator
MEALKGKCIEILRQTAAVVDAKAPSDATAFKLWLQQISEHVAKASKEGGFLGIGGVSISDAETATLTEISEALKV